MKRSKPQLKLANRIILGAAFDLEGTIIDLEHIHHQSHVLTAGEVGINLDLNNMREIIRQMPHFIGGGREAFVDDLLLLTKGGYSRDLLIERSKYHYHLLLQQETDIKSREGFIDLLSQLRQIGVETAIGSITPREQAIPLLERSGVMDLFLPGRIILKEDVRRPKPSPDVYLRTAEVLGIDPRSQLVFGDSINDALAAKAAGSPFIAMPVYYEVLREDLVREGAIEVYRDWRQVDLTHFFSKEGQKNIERD